MKRPVGEQVSFFVHEIDLKLEGFELQKWSSCIYKVKIYLKYPYKNR